MTVEELLERYAAGERDFSGANLWRCYLGGADLRDIILTDADLSESSLDGANLEFGTGAIKKS